LFGVIPTALFTKLTSQLVNENRANLFRQLAVIASTPCLATTIWPKVAAVIVAEVEPARCQLGKSTNNLIFYRLLATHRASSFAFLPYRLFFDLFSAWYSSGQIWPLGRYDQIFKLLLNVPTRKKANLLISNQYLID
jgi:hypothetical protein